MHHLADNRAGPDDRHLHHDVVEILRPQPRQAGHLRAALHLEHADGIGALQRPVHGRHRPAAGAPGRPPRRNAARDQFDRILEHRHHAQAQQVHLDDSHIRAVFLIPLHHHAPRHGGGLQRHDRIELPLADHHAAGVLPEVPRQVLHGEVSSKNFPISGLSVSSPASRNCARA
jgi:hypothetical protein